MNNIITLRRLSEQIAKEAGVEQAQAESFINALTAEISEALSKNENVKLRGIGEFKVQDQHVVFIPDSQLAETINEPFSMFAPEELDPEITTEDLKNPSKTLENHVEMDSDEKSSEVEKEEPQEEAEIEVKAEEAEVPIDSEEEVAEESIESDPEEAEASIDGEVENASVEFEVEVPEESIVSEAKEPATPLEEKSDLPIDTDEPSTPVFENLSEQKDAEEAQSEDVTPPAFTPRVTIQPFDDDDDDDEEEIEAAQEKMEKDKGFPIFWVMWGIIFGFILGLAIGFFVHDPIEKALEPTLEEDFFDEAEYSGDAEELPEMTIANQPEESPIEEANSVTSQEEEQPQQVAPSEPTEQPVATPAPKAEKPQADVYDTIREGNSLGSLAKKHYGSNVYWVYIYLENQSKISNPNRVAIGTVLRIPPLEKYAKKPTDAENKEDAQKKVNEILKKYPN